MAFSLKSWTHFLTKLNGGREVWIARRELSTIRAIRATPALRLGGQRRQFGIQNVKHHIGSHELELLRHDWIGFVARQHIFALNHKGVETFGKLESVTSTSLKICHLYQQPEDGVDWTKEFEPHDYLER
ncbi:hypothetical protein TNCV_550121 [Trichonephila clavipes]|nr:hypothetical protein TNCV_550121 [Trichonephila clavipes]